MHLLLFILFPALELYLLVKAGGEIGALNIVLWVFVSAIIGLWAVRAQGQGAMNRVRADMAEGRVPQNNFLDGLLLFLGGILLILPGLVTDAVGLFLLVPPLRHLAAQGLARYLTAQQARPGGASRVIFFRSTGPGATPFSGGPFTAQGRPDPFNPAGANEADDSPRQATIIESTAIDITPSAKDKDANGIGGGKQP
ncbi:FxsA family protein [Desulfovibrio sp. OttesenSCG-928-M16]|nr:FxsA family protein [Desulfovibrio sp. OttesenSCG-928-M16]